MKKSELVDIVIQGSYTAFGKEPPARGLISRTIGMALNALYFKVFSKNPANLADYMRPFILTPVQMDSNISIITLPVSTLQFNDIGDMVKISYQSDPELTFVPVGINEPELIQQILVIDSVVPFVVKGSSIWIYGLTRITPLLVECLVAFHELDDKVDVKIPSGLDLELIASVRELLGIAGK